MENAAMTQPHEVRIYAEGRWFSWQAGDDPSDLDHAIALLRYVQAQAALPVEVATAVSLPIQTNGPDFTFSQPK